MCAVISPTSMSSLQASPPLPLTLASPPNNLPPPKNVLFHSILVDFTSYDTVNACIPAKINGVSSPGSCSVLLCVKTAMTMPLNPSGKSATPFPLRRSSTFVNTTLSSRLFQPMYSGASQSYNGFFATSLLFHVKVCRPLERVSRDGLARGSTCNLGKCGYFLPRREGQDSDVC